MTTPIDSWAGSWLCVMRHQPGGDWLILGNDAERVGGVFTIERPTPDNDNSRRGRITAFPPAHHQPAEKTEASQS